MENAQTIEVHVNGQSEHVAEGTTVSSLLGEKGIRVELVAVELNGEILKREQCDQRQLQSGDHLEWLFYMAGGSILRGLRTTSLRI